MKAFENKGNLSEINFTRKCVGLPPLKCKEKRCTRCSRRFVTIAHDICCERCRDANQEIFDFVGAYGK